MRQKGPSNESSFGSTERKAPDTSRLHLGTALASVWLTTNSGLAYLRTVMIRALLTFNPEAHGSGGDKLLFGVAVPPRVRPFALSALEELNLASQFLEARSAPRMIALLQHIIHRASTARGRTGDPRIVGSLLQR